MSKVLVNETSLTAIANAIREKNGSENVYKPSEMGQAISSLTIGTADNVPDEIDLSGSCSSLFEGNRFNWLIENYNDRIKPIYTTGINNIFYNNPLTSIPLTLYVGTNNIQQMFYYCNNLEELPIVYKNRDDITLVTNLFYECNRLRNIPDTFLQTNGTVSNRISASNLNQMFYHCYSLRKLPMFFDNLYETYSFNNTFYQCYALDKIENFPVNTLRSPSSMSNTLYHCYRLSDFTFATNEDGTPYTVNWGGFTLDLTGIGYLGADDSGNIDESFLLNYNSGITADKKVSTLAEYNSLKDDPDWYSATSTFSRYNKDSAYRTIQSLPDASTYITENSAANNTLKLKNMGYPSTSTLTADQIAIATAKGWTVSFV